MKLCWSLKKHNHLPVKLFVAVLLTGLVFRLFVFKSNQFTSPSDLETSVADDTVVDRTEIVPRPEREPEKIEEKVAEAPVDSKIEEVSDYEEQTQMRKNGNFLGFI